MTNGLLTIKEASNYLGVHPNTLRNWDKEGKLHPVRINERGDRRYDRNELDYLILKTGRTPREREKGAKSVCCNAFAWQLRFPDRNKCGKCGQECEITYSE